MTTRPYPLRIPDGIVHLAALRSQDDRTDKSTVLRQWLYAAAEAYALTCVAEGRLTISQTAEILDLSLYDVQRKAQEQGVEIGATAAQYHQAVAVAACKKNDSGLQTRAELGSQSLRICQPSDSQ